MSFNAVPCLIPPLLASNHSGISAFLPFSGPKIKFGIEEMYGFYRTLRKLNMVIGGGTDFPRSASELGAMVASGVVGSITESGGVWTLTDSSADFESGFTRCTNSVSAAFVRIYYRDDRRGIAQAKVTVTSGTTVTLDIVDWVARGIVPAVADLAGCNYQIFDSLDLEWCDGYARWADPPNTFEYVSNASLVASDQIPGSTCIFPTKIVVFLGSPGGGSYILAVNGSNTSSIAFGASAVTVQSAIQAKLSGGSCAVVAGPANTYYIALDPTNSATTLTLHSSSITGGSALVLTTSNLLLDTSQTWKAGQWLIPQPKWPDSPLTFCVKIWDNGTGGDNNVREFAIASNTTDTVTTATLGSYWPSLNCYYSITKKGGYWNPQAKSFNARRWYTGAMTGEGATTHLPDDSIGGYPGGLIAGEVTWIDGNSITSDCLDSPPHEAFDTDLVNEYCGASACSAAPKFYAPNIWKSFRQIQNTIASFGAPWIVNNWAGSGSTTPPHQWSFAEAANSINLNAGTGTASISSATTGNLYCTIPLLPVIGAVWYALIDAAGNFSSSGLTTIASDMTGTYITGVWDTDSDFYDGWTLYYTYGFTNRYPYHFNLINKMTRFQPSLDDSGDVVDPPGLTADGVTDNATATATIGTGANAGKIISCTTTDHGAGYSTVPVVIITGDGTGARAVGNLSGSTVGSISVVNQGHGYTTATVTVVYGGAIRIGSWITRNPSTTYESWNQGVTADSGIAFTTGDLARYVGDQSFDPTLADFGGGDNLAPYADKGFVGVCGASPPNLLFAGKKLNVSDGFYYSTSIASDGTGTNLATGRAVSFANTSGLTTQLSIARSAASNWFQGWYSGTLSTTVSGSATGGSSTTLIDSSASFLPNLLGLTVRVTHTDTTIDLYTITGVTPTTLTISTGSENVASGNAYTISVPGCTMAIASGIVTTGGTSTITDSAAAGSPWLASGYFDLGFTLRVNHNNGDGTQTQYKFLITAVNQGGGEITFQGIDSVTVAVGDYWEVDIPQYNLNRWQSYYLLVSSNGTSWTVQAQANDQNTLFIHPQSGFALTAANLSAGITFKFISFVPGSVLKWDGTKWIAPVGRDSRIDPATGHNATFQKTLNGNQPFEFESYGPIHIGTAINATIFNEAFAIVKTLNKALGNPHCRNQSSATASPENNIVLLEPGTFPSASYGPDYTDDGNSTNPNRDTAWGYFVAECADKWLGAPHDETSNGMVDNTCPQSTISYQCTSPPIFFPDQFTDGMFDDINITRSYAYPSDTDIPTCLLSGCTVTWYMYSEITGGDLAEGTTTETFVGPPNEHEQFTAHYDATGTPLQYHKYIEVGSASSAGADNVFGPQVGQASTTFPSLTEPPDAVPFAEPTTPTRAFVNYTTGYIVTDIVAVRDWSSSLAGI